LQEPIGTNNLRWRQFDGSSYRNEIRLRLAELDGDLWFDDEEPLTDAEKAVLEARLAAYEKDPDAGS
jgi:hypothetical protein